MPTKATKGGTKDQSGASETKAVSAKKVAKAPAKKVVVPKTARAAKAPKVAKVPAKKRETTVPAKAVRPKKKVDKPKRLVVAEPERSFWTTDGQIFRSLHELATAFGAMNDTVFVYHVTSEKNDFAEWVEHVLQDQACAADLRKAKNPKKAHLVTLKHVSLYSL